MFILHNQSVFFCLNMVQWNKINWTERCGEMKLPSMLKINKTSEKYWTVFLITFGIMMVIMLPTMIFNKGIFLYYGDFNSQQLPFYTHAHEMIRSGNIFGIGALI